jgi:putative ABC transport system permease protein
VTIPLAWLQLSRERIRLLVALAGIGFADILMFMQLGFRDALFDSATLVHRKLNADLVLVSPQAEALHRLGHFSRRYLYQTLSIEQVKSVAPLYVSDGEWKNPENGRTRTLLVFGFNPAQPILDLPGVKENLNKMRFPDVILFDRASRPEYGEIEQGLELGKSIETELNGRRIKVGGLFTLGASFAADGNLITSDTNILRLFPDRESGQIELGLIQLKPGANLLGVQAKLQAQFKNNLNVYTYEEFIEFEKNYWASSTPIGFIFTLGTAVGFIVGTVIVYQILYSDVTEHLPEYATLKAMGYTNKYLLAVVFQEALILAILGYIPAFFISGGLYALTKAATNLPLIMQLGRAVTVLFLTIVMCSCSGAIAVRRLQDADPADIF